MQHIRTDEELEKVWRGMLRSVPLEERLEVFSLLQKEQKKPRKPGKKRK